MQDFGVCGGKSEVSVVWWAGAAGPEHSEALAGWDGHRLGSRAQGSGVGLCGYQELCAVTQARGKSRIYVLYVNLIRLQAQVPPSWWEIQL